MSDDLNKYKFGTPLFEKSGAVGAALELEIEEFWPFSHWFAGVDFFDDEELTTPAIPGAGTIDVTVESVVTDAPSTVSTIDATAVIDSEVNFATNPNKIIFTPTGITTANFYRVRAVGNVS